MFKPFTFNFPASTIANPFIITRSQVAGAPDDARGTPVPVAPGPTAPGRARPLPRRPRPAPEPSPPRAPRSLKRGWDPAFAEPSTTTTTATGAGILDIPSKQRKMCLPGGSGDSAAEEDGGELPPPPKRRRTIAGSIISTALSAALIGTAVGLTVYRLWKDRGREPDQLPPPPPYEENGWTPAQKDSDEFGHARDVSPSKPALHAPAPGKTAPQTPARPRKTRHVVAGRTTNTLRHRKSYSRTSVAPPRTPPLGVASPARGQVPPEFDFDSVQVQAPSREEEEAVAKPDEEMDTDTSMEWIGDRISQLIAEGQRALGREIVVDSERPEDEVDDGTGDWVDAEPAASPSASVSRRGSARRRPRSLAPPSYPGSPDAPQLAFPRAATATPPRPARDASADSVRSARERAEEWESPHLREFMERARAARMAAR